jgi:excisionase family DNA binding protein
MSNTQSTLLNDTQAEVEDEKSGQATVDHASMSHLRRSTSTLVANLRPSDEMLNVVEAAAHLNIRPWTLRHWIKDRRIEFVKYGNGSVRIRKSVIERYLSKNTVKARPAHGRP